MGFSRQEYWSGVPFFSPEDQTHISSSAGDSLTTEPPGKPEKTHTCAFKSISWLYLVYGEGNGNPLQYSCLENPMDRGAWWAAFHGVAKSRVRLSDFTFTFHFHALEKEMAAHPSVLAWRIPETGESGGLPSVGSHRVEHN